MLVSPSGPGTSTAFVSVFMLSSAFGLFHRQLEGCAVHCLHSCHKQKVARTSHLFQQELYGSAHKRSKLIEVRQQLANRRLATINVYSNTGKPSTDISKHGMRNKIKNKTERGRAEIKHPASLI
jgi:hypothetical protein